MELRQYVRDRRILVPYRRYRRYMGVTQIKAQATKALIPRCSFATGLEAEMKLIYTVLHEEKSQEHLRLTDIDCKTRSE